MKIVLRKLNKDMNGPSDFATVTEQQLIEEGYVWSFNVFQDGQWVRTGVSKIKTESEIRAYIVSGMNRVEWEAMHA